MSSAWTITTHTIPAAFPREHPRSTINLNTPLRLSLKQYTPKNLPSLPGDVTLILTHGNGYHKELYEPFFDELLTLTLTNSTTFRIRSIWALDAANQGASGVLNEALLGEDPCWNDYSRDLEQMVTFFAAQMPSPRIGIGHSMGGQCIFECALRNPSLFIAIIGIDPVLEKDGEYLLEPGSHPIVASTRRRDIWDSQGEAEEYFRSRPFWKAWDPRAVDAQIKHGLRPLPSHNYPTSTGVTLITSKPQEIYQFLRPHPTHPTLHRPESHRTFTNLPHLTLPILYIFGSLSYVSSASAMKSKLAQTPHAESIMIAEAGHTIPQEKPRECAVAVAAFVGREARRCEKERDEEGRRPVNQVVTEEFLRRVSKL